MGSTLRRQRQGRGGGGGGCIAATLFFHEHEICLQKIVVRQWRKNKKRSYNAILAATNSDYTSRICPPAGQRRRLERGARMLLPRSTNAADRRHAQNVLCCLDASGYFSKKLCPIPGTIASRQILPTSPPHKCPGGHNKDDDG